MFKHCSLVDINLAPTSPRTVNLAKAKELVYTARIVDGEEAQQISLVNQVVFQEKTGDAAYQAVLGFFREILPNGPIVIMYVTLDNKKDLK